VMGGEVRGINLLNALYHVEGASIPVAFELVKKPIQYSDLKTRKVRRASERGHEERAYAPDDGILLAKQPEISVCADG
jgi:hypothetical protein